ncbi:MAG: ParB N-terminal domain-containing protein [Terriglobales bacterium]
MRPVLVKHDSRRVTTLIDGHHRFEAHLRAGREHIDCFVSYPFSEWATGWSRAQRTAEQSLSGKAAQENRVNAL